MSDVVIQVENLSKYDRLGLIGGGTLREDVSRWIAKLQGKPNPLLKILSRITAPTECRIRIKGRVGSLLEVGAGFHPELVGRERVKSKGVVPRVENEEIDQTDDAGCASRCPG